jgi:hypothetical protein
MEILTLDDWTCEHIVTAFLRDFCPEEKKAEVQALLDAKDWQALDTIIIPFHNIES